MIFVRSLLFNIWFWSWTTVLNLIYLPALALPWWATVSGQRNWARGIIWMMPLIAGIRIEIRGRENLPKGAVMIASKHQSAWDTLIWHVITDDPALVMKKELLSIPVYGWYCRKSRMIPVDREGGRKALKKMVAAANAAKDLARPIIIFPQGTRVAPGADAPYLPGVAALYRQLDLPCVPVTLNSGYFWGRNAFTRRPGTIVLEYLEPIPAGLKRKEFMEILETRTEAASAKLLEEAQNS